MVIEKIRCHFYGGESIVKNGVASEGKQKNRGKGYGKQSREQLRPNGCPEERKEENLRAYEERLSLKGLSRTFDTAPNTVGRWPEKRRSREDTLVPAVELKRLCWNLMSCGR